MGGFPPEAVERTKSAQTRKGYDTTGFKYQYIVDRMNEQLGICGWRTTAEYVTRESKAKSGRPMFDVLCDLTIELGWADSGDWHVAASRSMCGGHVSATLADAKKGAYTNAFKKTAALFGVGAEAYRGEIDDDNRPRLRRQPEHHRSTQRQAGQHRADPDPETPWGEAVSPELEEHRGILRTLLKSACDNSAILTPNVEHIVESWHARLPSPDNAKAVNKATVTDAQAFCRRIQAAHRIQILANTLHELNISFPPLDFNRPLWELPELRGEPNLAAIEAKLQDIREGS